MFNFLKPPAHRSPLPAEQQKRVYPRLRWQVFLGVFIGYAGYYLVRKNFSVAIPELKALGYNEGELGFALSAVSVAYGISKFVMGNVSDRSNARVFLSLGLLLSALIILFMGVSPWATSSVPIMFTLLFLNGWVQGMGWPSSGRALVHWFSFKERGTKMSIWNTAHNIGGAAMGSLAGWALEEYGWQSAFIAPAIAAVLIAVIAFLLVRDTPQSCGLSSIEEYKNDYVENYSVEHEKELSAKEIFRRYILPNKVLWYIAIINIFIYMVRYGVLDWAPTYLREFKGYSIKESSWAYAAFEYAGIPGTILCGWISDKYFQNRRAPAIILYMILVTIAVVVYWQNPVGQKWIDYCALIAIGFLIYGPVMLIGVFALDLVPKKAAGTAAGLTGLFGYLFGSVGANWLIGEIVEQYKWQGGFITLLIACILAIVVTLFTGKYEKKRLSD